MSKELSLQETGAMLLAAEKIVLCTHVSPDGDTLGSTLGLARFLLAQGKQKNAFEIMKKISVVSPQPLFRFVRHKNGKFQVVLQFPAAYILLRYRVRNAFLK